ncbi:MAG: glucose-6-phosphate dehydrogenase [Candidatus Bipolaricaulota bacterium]|nr:MAG: glucose-6-phosphate dehydrogenase [Candidatus Bipolaricaulota bacterium]
MAQPTVVVIFGASGDLTQRKLGPALHSLSCEGQLPASTKIIGVARTALSDESFRARIEEGVEAYARLKPGSNLCSLWSTFEERFSYLAGALEDPQTYSRLRQRLTALASSPSEEANVLFYFAIPPQAVETVVRQLAEAGLHHASRAWRRAVFEKPFGVDRTTASQLNELVREVFREPQVYRIDHYLGKETVQNILVMRFSNTVFEPLWNRDHVDHIQITLAETVGAEHRASYYDQTGVVRDIVQNHGMQLLALTMMERPEGFDAASLRDAKRNVLEAIKEPTREDVVLGQYESYRDEAGVDPDSRTPTFVALRLRVDTWRWRGVPVYLRSGKRLPAKTTEITVQFKTCDCPPLLSQSEPNRLMLRLQPNEGIGLQIETKLPGAGLVTKPTDLVFDYADHFGAAAAPDAYERLLLDAIAGDPSLFIRDDEIEASWSAVEPVLRLHEESSFPVSRYKDGCWGPETSDEMLEADGRLWLAECSPSERGSQCVE